MILSGWVTQGPEVAAFEREFAAYVGAPHACARLELHDGAAPGAARGRRRPRRRGHHRQPLVHRDRQRDPLLRRHAGVRRHRAGHLQHRSGPASRRRSPPRTKAILCVHQLGMPCDLARIVAIGRRRGLPVIEDAACAIGSEILLERPVGEDRQAARRHRLLLVPSAQGDHDRRRRHADHGESASSTASSGCWRQHGMSVPDTVRHGADEVIFESYPEVGFNYRMTDMQAAIGREQLKRLPEILADAGRWRPHTSAHLGARA